MAPDSAANLGRDLPPSKLSFWLRRRAPVATAIIRLNEIGAHRASLAAARCAPVRTLRTATWPTRPNRIRKTHCVEIDASVAACEGRCASDVANRARLSVTLDLLSTDGRIFACRNSQPRVSTYENGLHMASTDRIGSHSQ